MPRPSSGIERVAIVDWDVHHGNGTEAIVRGDESILFVSLHQWPFYPGTGGPGRRRTIVNIPLAAGSGDAAYAEAFRTIVEPAVRSFEPGLLIVSAGFDAHVDDPLADMASRRTDSGRWRRAARSSPRGSPPCSRAATTSRRSGPRRGGTRRLRS